MGRLARQAFHNGYLVRALILSAFSQKRAELVALGNDTPLQRHQKSRYPCLDSSVNAAARLSSEACGGGISRGTYTQ